MIKLLLALTLIGFSAPLHAAWLALCPANIGSEPDEFRFNGPDGEEKILRLVAQDPPESCIATALPVSADAVQWFTLLSAGQAAQIGQSHAVILQGVQNGKHFFGEVSLDNGASAPANPPPWPLYLDLREQLDITPFGQEERASLERNAANFTFRCRAGEKPAGFVISAGSTRLPQPPELKLKLELQAIGDFIWSASQTGAGQDPLPLAKLQADDRPHTEVIDLTPMLAPLNSWDSWILLCPQTQAELTLHSLQLTAKSSPPSGRATWIWQEADWRRADAELWQKLADLNITTLYITVPLSADLTRVADTQALQAFIKLADQHGIGVWAVTGDPLAVLESERESWRRRAEAYAAYNREAPESTKLKGVQYDIEPYLAPGYAKAPEFWKQAYINTLQMLRLASPLAMDVTVPVWWANETLKDKPLLEAMTAWVDSITVMDYRTDPWRIQQQALPYLSWAVHHRKNVRIALETGPVADETRLVFHHDNTGQLRVVHVGELSLLLRLAAPITNGDDQTFTLTEQIAVPGSVVSFHGHTDEMLKRLPQLEQALGVWPTFVGLALHEVLTP